MNDNNFEEIILSNEFLVVVVLNNYSEESRSLKSMIKNMSKL